jgi:hypothetical protein
MGCFQWSEGSSGEYTYSGILSVEERDEVRSVCTVVLLPMQFNTKLLDSGKFKDNFKVSYDFNKREGGDPAPVQSQTDIDIATLHVQTLWNCKQ